MPNLNRLLEELAENNIDPREIQLPGALYDALLEQGESEADEDEQD
ncbi:hypothetical protein ACFLVQ_00310 [Chloroflexota bacterium]